MSSWREGNMLHPRSASRIAFRTFGLWGCCLLLVLSASSGKVSGDEPKESKPDSPSIEPLWEQSRTMLSEIRKLDPETTSNFVDEEAGFSLLLEDSWLGVTNGRVPNALRYYSAHLVILNTGSEDVQLSPKGIVLNSGGTSFALSDQFGQIELSPIRVGDNNTTGRELVPPETLLVPANGMLKVPLVFVGLSDATLIPSMRIDVTVGDRKQSLDVNRYEQVRLSLTSESLGPRDCLKLITLHGALNPVNVGVLVSELEQFADVKGTRVVVAWGDNAAPVDDTTRDWLESIDSSRPYGAHAFRYWPVFPSAISTLHFVKVPGAERESPNDNSHTSVDSAVSEALRSAIESLPADDVLTYVRQGHSLARAATLRWGASRLPADALPLVLSFADSDETPLQRAAIDALGSFSQPEAMQRLEQFARHGTAEQSEAALRSLVASRFPAAHQTVLRLDLSTLSVPGEKVLRLLAEHPRVEWQSLLLSAARSPNRDVRIEALRTLDRTGHPQLLSVLEETLESDDELSRNLAFTILVGREDRESDEVAMRYVLEQIAESPPSGPVFNFLMRTRDPRAVPHLLKHFEREPRRSDVVRLLANLGDQTVMQTLAESFDRLSDSDRVDVLDLMSVMQSPYGPKLALQSLREENNHLVSRAATLLRSREDDAIVTELAEILAKASSRHSKNQICNTLAAIGTPLAKDTLRNATQSEDKDTREYALTAYRALRLRSPAGPAVESAHALVLSDRLGDADRQLSLAEKLDPEFPILYFVRGELRRQEKKEEEALAEYRKAIALDDQYMEAYARLGDMLFHLRRFDEAIPLLRRTLELEPTNLQAITSLGIALAIEGDVDEGINLATAGLDKYKSEPGYPVFLYNVACVYGRAIERVSNDPEAGPSDPRVAKYTETAIDLLERAINADVGAFAATGEKDMYAFMREDADLNSLHGVPSFRKLARFPEP